MLIGEKVRLRLLEREDIEMIARWRNDPRISRQFFGIWPLPISEQERWYEGYLTDPTERMWIIETPQGQAIGTMALLHIDHRNQSAEIGRVLIGDSNHLAAECASEALQLLATFAFLEANLNRLYVHVLQGNESAIKLYEGSGFQQEGILRRAVWKSGQFLDVIEMAMLRGDLND